MSEASAVTANMLKKRTRDFALRIIRLFRALPKTDEARIIGKQILRSGTSVGANYRASCRARSPKEFMAKLGVVIEEADESLFWLDLLGAAGIVPEQKLTDLKTETEELIRIFARSVDTTRRRYVRKSQMKNQNSKI